MNASTENAVTAIATTMSIETISLVLSVWLFSWGVACSDCTSLPSVWVEPVEAAAEPAAPADCSFLAGLVDVAILFKHASGYVKGANAFDAHSTNKY